MNTHATTPRPIPALKHGGLTFGRFVRSEWTKLRSLRSTGYALLATVAILIAFGIIDCATTVSNWAALTAKQKASFDPLLASLRGVDGAQLAIGVLGVLVITGEYTTGTIRTTFAAVPRRLPVLSAKATTFTAVSFALTVPGALIAFFGGQWILDGQHISIAFNHPGVPRAVIGAALYLTMLGLFALGLGALIRNTAGAIATLIAIIFVLPTLVSVLPPSVKDTIGPYLPTNAGDAITTIHQPAHTLAPWTGFGLLGAYVATIFLAAALLLRRRDV
jgi:ABC-type transport system involved in multi-copper enzyme maturation permease subunit